MKLKNVLEGWANWTLDEFNMLPADIKALAEQRLSICNTCEFRKGSICGECGCVLKAKTKSPNSNCPKNKWL